MTTEAFLLTIILAFTAPLWGPFAFAALATVLVIIAATVEYSAMMLAGIAGLKSDKTKEK